MFGVRREGGRRRRAVRPRPQARDGRSASGRSAARSAGPVTSGATGSDPVMSPVADKPAFRHADTCSAVSPGRCVATVSDRVTPAASSAASLGEDAARRSPARSPTRAGGRPQRPAPVLMPRMGDNTDKARRQLQAPEPRVLSEAGRILRSGTCNLEGKESGPR
jgi:hypothetical protein